MDEKYLAPYKDESPASRSPVSSPDLEKNDRDTIRPRWKRDNDRNVQPRLTTRDKIINIQCILLNTLSTVMIVFMNKIILSEPQLRKCQISIAAWHFFATAVVLYIATLRPFRAFPAVRIRFVSMLTISAFFAGFLLLGNLSLAYNTVGFYQLAKIMTTPTVVFLNFILFRSTVLRTTFVSILVTCLGVGLVTSTVLFTNPIGLVVAACAFTVTALYQIWIGKKIQDLNVSPAQLLLNQAPVSVLLLLCAIPFVDTFPASLELIPKKTLYILFLSGILASLLNLSQFLIIGRTSALTFNIISQVKTIVIVSLSWYMESKALTWIDICGVVLALSGAWAYSQCAGKNGSGNNNSSPGSGGLRGKEFDLKEDEKKRFEFGKEVIWEKRMR